MFSLIIKQNKFGKAIGLQIADFRFHTILVFFFMGTNRPLLDMIFINLLLFIGVNFQSGPNPLKL